MINEIIIRIYLRGHWNHTRNISATKFLDSKDCKLILLVNLINALIDKKNVGNKYYRDLSVKDSKHSLFKIQLLSLFKDQKR